MDDRPKLPLLAPSHSVSSLDDRASALDVASRRRTTTACSACKARKSKCDDETPCTACRSHDSECIKDENLDRRRKIAFKRRIQDLEVDRQILDDLVRALRVGNADQVSSIIDIIKRYSPREELQAHLHRILIENQSLMDVDPPFKQPPAVTTEFSHHARRSTSGRIQDLMNPPISVPAKPWTSVTDDDDLVSHLMSLWFTWAHPWWHWVEEGIFLEAMRAGDLSTPFCSPCLVNMILADACLLDAMGANDIEPKVELREKFHAEGKRLLEDQKGVTSMTVVQAMGVHWTYLNTNGQDKIGTQVLYLQVYKAKDLPKWRKRLEKDNNPSRELLDKVDHCLDRLVWSIYTLNSFTLLGYPKFQALDRPDRGKPAPKHDQPYQSNWLPYPEYRAHHEKFHADCHYHALVSLAEKACHEEAVYLFQRDAASTRSMNDFLELYEELRLWPNTLPDCMRLHDGALPHVIALHAMHAWVIIILSKQAAAADAGRSRNPTLISTSGSNESPQWKSAAVSAAVSVGQMMNLQCRYWGVDHFPVIIIQPVALALFALLEDLEPVENNMAFIDLSITLRSASKRFRVAKGISKLLLEAADKNGIVVPQEARQIIQTDYASDKETQYSLDLGQISMDYLLDKWEDLSLW